MKKRILICALAAAIAAGAAMTSFAGGWQKSGSEWTYVEDSGKTATNVWKKGADNQWRWVNSRGVMATNSWADGEYYVDGDGKIITSQWKKLSKKDGSSSTMYWYYFGNSGKCLSDGWAKINGKYYYFNDDGEMQTGWVDSRNYYNGSDGAMKVGWAYCEDPDKDDDDDDGPYVDSPNDGGDSHWFYFESSGKKYEPGSTSNGYGLKKIDGYYYCFNEDGEMQTGWVYVKDAGNSFKSYRYCGDDGKVKTKWAMLTPPDGEDDDLGLDYGTDEEWYYFDSKGVPEVGPDADNASTSNLKKINGITYLFNEKGNPVYGLRKLQIGKTGTYSAYFFGADKATSSVQTGTGNVEEADGSTHEYYFQTNSSTKGRGFTGVHENKLYYMGRLQTAENDSYRIVAVGGNHYIVNRSGKVQKKDTVKIGGVKYKTNSTGAIYQVDGASGNGGDAAEEPTEPNFWED